MGHEARTILKLLNEILDLPKVNKGHVQLIAESIESNEHMTDLNAVLKRIKGYSES